MYHAEVIADSRTKDGLRLTTVEVEYPHAIHKDVMTHRIFSRNFQSFRAFPPEKVIEKILDDPFEPEAYRQRNTGMEGGAVVSKFDHLHARNLWQKWRAYSISTARQMIKLDLSKDQVNFVLQDHTWIRGVISSTEWDNFDALRAFAEEGAKPRPEVEKIAQMVYATRQDSTPKLLLPGEWHLPYVSWAEIYNDPNRPESQATTAFTPNWEFWKKVSTGRCARISYLTHKGVRDPRADVELHDRLLGNGHMSPFEHPASPQEWHDHCHEWTVEGAHRETQNWCGNFHGFHQYRKDVPYEDNYGKMREFVGV